MKKLYVWDPKKKSGKQHVWIDGEPACVMSNRQKTKMLGMSEAPNKSRKVCGGCLAAVVGKSPAKPKAKRTRATGNGFYKTAEWKRMRYLALKRSDGRCQCCGIGAADGARLNVDHIKPRGRFPELALNLDNLQVLCGSCNAGKGGWDETDWREPRLATLMGERIA